MNPQSAPPQQRWWLRRLVNRMEMDRATFYVVATRGWRLMAGLLTATLIGTHFSPEVQGYYFSFWSLLEFQALVDLGISGVIIQSATHEWADCWLEQGAASGPEDKRLHLAAIIQFFQRWFLRAAAVFAVVIGLFGLWFFADGSSSSLDVSWRWPWLALALVSAVSLTMTPRIALLEGCGQIAAVNRMRLLQMVGGHLGVWSAILLGCNLWVAVVAASIQVLGETALLASFRTFFRSLPLAPPGAEPRDWRELVRPMQRRLGFQTAVRFFANNMLTPVILRYHGAAAAGPVGMTWSLLKSLQHAAFAWVQTRGPLFGQYVAKREFEKLDRVFRRLAIIAASLMAVSVALASLAVAALPRIPQFMPKWIADLLPTSWENVPLELATRMLDGWHTALIGATFTLTLIATAFGLYLSAHRRAPLAWLTVLCDLLTAALVWRLGSLYGVTPAVWAMFGVTALLLLPGAALIWARCRRQWQQ